MLLPYGQKNGHLIHISEVKRGRTDLVCPYCQQTLIARKGKQLAHHFAHETKSCLSGNNDFFGLKSELPTQLTLLQYTQKQLNETQKQLNKFRNNEQQILRQSEWNKKWIRMLVQQLDNHTRQDAQIVRKQIIQYCKDEFSTFPSWRLLELDDFGSPTPMLQYARQALNNYHSTEHKLIETQERLQLYESDWAWFKQFQLYFLKITTGEYASFYKIGLTSRAISVRLREIELDLSSLFQAPHIEVLFITEGVAFLEHFFKRKYQSHRYKLEQFTEYFYFEPYQLDRLLKMLQKVKTYKNNLLP